MAVKPEIQVLSADTMETVLPQIHRGDFAAAVVRGVYTAAEVRKMAEATRTGELDAFGQNRDASDEQASQIRTLGVPISPSDRYPQGPDIEAYHQSAEPFRVRCAEVFAPARPFDEVANAFLASAAGVPAVRATDPQGRFFGALTVRIIPPGHGLPPHCENHYRHIAIYDTLRERVHLDRKIGFFLPLQLPESGGELVVYDTPFEAGVYPFPALPLDRVEEVSHTVVPARPGDLVFVGSGRTYHQVTRVVGDQPRITVGGFGAFRADLERFVFWA